MYYQEMEQFKTRFFSTQKLTIAASEQKQYDVIFLSCILINFR